jgi:hypothetical protein
VLFDNLLENEVCSLELSKMGEYKNSSFKRQCSAPCPRTIVTASDVLSDKVVSNQERSLHQPIFSNNQREQKKKQ